MSDNCKRGMEIRRNVLGDAHVDGAESAKTDLENISDPDH